jgi:hypothetical protein
MDSIIDSTVPVFNDYLTNLLEKDPIKFMTIAANISSEGILAIMRLSKDNADLILEALTVTDNDPFNFKKAELNFSSGTLS